MSWSISPRRVRRHCAMSLLRPCSPPLQRLHQTKLQHDQCPTLPERLPIFVASCRSSSFPFGVVKTQFLFFTALKYWRIFLLMLPFGLLFLVHSLSCQYITLSACLNVSAATQVR